MMNPISILDTNPFSTVANFCFFNNHHQISSNKNSQHQHPWEQPSNKQGIGLALIDENFETDNSKSTIKQQKRKLIVFGSQLSIQVPNSSIFPCFSSESPREFGIKTPRSNLWEESFMGFGYDGLSMNDIDEQSEDYTCVISHGPNPKTIHMGTGYEGKRPFAVKNAVAKECFLMEWRTSLPKTNSPNFSNKASHYRRGYPSIVIDGPNIHQL